MASGDLPINGTYGNSAIPPSTSPGPKTQDVPKDEVAWYFVERYYNTLSRNPKNLYLFFNKRSQYVVGVEEEKVQVNVGQNVSQETGYSDSSDFLALRSDSRLYQHFACHISICWAG